MRLFLAIVTLYFIASLFNADVHSYAIVPIALYVLASRFKHGSAVALGMFTLFCVVRYTALFDSVRALLNEGIIAAAKWGYKLPLQYTENDATLAVSVLLLAMFMTCTKKHVVTLLVMATLLPPLLQLHYPIAAYTTVVTSCILIYSKLHANTYKTIASAIALCTLLVIAVLPQLTMFTAIGDVLEQRKAYIVDRQHNDTMLTNGDFSNIEPFEQNDLPAFTITMNDPHPLYLKSYVGTTFDNGWVHREEDALQYGPIDGELAATNFSRTQLATAAEQDHTTVVIEPQNISKKQLLTPYELASLNEDVRVNESTVTQRGLFASNSYTYTISTTAYNEYPTVASSLYTTASDDYLRLEALHNYRSYAQYTELPQDVRTMLANHVDIPPHTTYEETIAFVQRSMSLLTYNENASMKNEDVLSYMLEQSKEGYSVHYATLATLLFRAAGVPARYVEGYIVTTDDASSQTMTISSNNRHAWPEIYVDYIGWIPVEVTPGYASKMPPLTQTTYEQQAAPQTSTAPLQSATPSVSEVKPPKFDEDPTAESEEQSFNWSWLLLLLLIPAMMMAMRVYKKHRRIDVRFMTLITRYNKHMKTNLPTYRVIAAINTDEAHELYALYNEHMYYSRLSDEQLIRIRAVQKIVNQQFKAMRKQA